MLKTTSKNYTLKKDSELIFSDDLHIPEDCEFVTLI